VATLPEVSVHEGYFQTKAARLPLASSPPHPPEIVEVLQTEEKGSDVNLAIHLLQDALARTPARVQVGSSWGRANPACGRWTETSPLPSRRAFSWIWRRAVSLGSP